MDFAALNDGPFGIRRGMIPAAGYQQNYTVFYQPCERMKCPVGYTCPDMGYASVLVCLNSVRRCESYGTIAEGINVVGSYDFDRMQLNYLNVTHNHSSTRRMTIMNLTCNATVPQGHYLWEPVLSQADTVLSLKASTSMACVTFSPTPMPVIKGDMCELEFGNSFLNLTMYNVVNHSRQDPNGWQGEVTVGGDYGGQNATLHYQPCDGMSCPAKAQCEGDDYGTVWLCLGEQRHDCIGYGLFYNNLTAETGDDSVIVTYTADRHRQALVTFTQDPSVPNQTTLVLPRDVTVTGTTLSFTVTVQSFLQLPAPPIGRVTGGAVFLLIVIIAAVLYLSVGYAYAYVKFGTFQIPNPAFWDEVYSSILTAFAWIFGHHHAGQHPVERAAPNSPSVDVGYNVIK
jgi:hypothetical protein